MKNLCALFGLICLIFISVTKLSGQSILEKSDDDIYHVDRWVSAGVIVGGNITNYLGQDRIRKKDRIPLETILALNKSDVWSLDRGALTQDITHFEDFLEISDIGLTIGPMLPLLLGFDKKIRKDWLDVFLVYAEAQTLVANVYAWTPMGPTFIERLRPIAYYDNVPEEDRTWGGNRNSFFSGHVSTITVGTMFTVQALMDAHPNMRKKAWLWYGVGALPAAYMGWLRVKGLKHFPSDVLTGFLVGTAGAILIPEFHKRKFKSTISLFHNQVGTGLVWVKKF